MYYCRNCGKAFSELEYELEECDYGKYRCPNCDHDTVRECDIDEEEALVQCKECGEWFMPEEDENICRDCKSKKNHIKGKTIYCDFSNIERIRKEELERELKQVAEMLARPNKE